MNTRLFILTLVLIGLYLQGNCGNRKDTLNIYSAAFGETRKVYVETPEFFDYDNGKDVRYPVIYILDGQHEWFTDPLHSTLRNLQYTHEIPQCIVVTIPHDDRIKECAIPKKDNEESELLKFITDELSTALEAYRAHDMRYIIGHSFTASFALYAYLQAPQHFHGVIAHSPLNAIMSLAERLKAEPERLKNIYLSVGGAAQSKDMHHRKAFEELKANHPEFVAGINCITADFAGHNAVPMVTSAAFLTQHFFAFSDRFTFTPEIDMNYKLVNEPKAANEILDELHKLLVFKGYIIQPEIPDFNGIASRYINNGYYEHASVIYAFAAQLYPNYYEFAWYLGELYHELGRPASESIAQLERALFLLKTYEASLPEQEEYIAEIEKLLAAYQ
jgi:predicted alpha/beta superfamily hydrolase